MRHLSRRCVDGFLTLPYVTSAHFVRYIQGNCPASGRLSRSSIVSDAVQVALTRTCPKLGIAFEFNSWPKKADLAASLLIVVPCLQAEQLLCGLAVAESNQDPTPNVGPTKREPIPLPPSTTCWKPAHEPLCQPCAGASDERPGAAGTPSPREQNPPSSSPIFLLQPRPLCTQPLAATPRNKRA